jgi:hypothetical protein
MEAVSEAQPVPGGIPDKTSTDTITSEMEISPLPSTRKCIILSSITRSSKETGRDSVADLRPEPPQKDRKKWYHSLGSRRIVAANTMDLGEISANRAQTRDCKARWLTTFPDHSPTPEDDSGAPLASRRSLSRAVRSWKKRLQSGQTYDTSTPEEVEVSPSPKPQAATATSGRRMSFEYSPDEVDLLRVQESNNTFRSKTEQAFRGTREQVLLSRGRVLC